MDRKLKISVVTVSYNSENEIELTILSMLSQSYANKEYIIIDGGSTDRTTSIIRKYESEIDFWISEKDHGMYDAINKGIDKATGDYILILNSGDYLINNRVVKKAVEKIISIGVPCSVIFGRTVYAYKGKIQKGWCWPPIGIYDESMDPHHQAAFVNRDIYNRFLYDCRFKMAGDHEFWARIRKFGKVPFHYIDQEIVVFELGGMSNSIEFQIERYIENTIIAFLYAQNRVGAFIIRLGLNLAKAVSKYLVLKVLGKRRYYQIMKQRNFLLVKNRRHIHSESSTR